MSITTTICDSFEGVIFILSIREYICSFKVLEIILITQSMIFIKSLHGFSPLLHATFYSFAFNTDSCFIQSLNTLILFECSFIDIYHTAKDCLIHRPGFILRCGVGIVICMLTQVFAYLHLGNNMRRKIFHIAGFFILMDSPREVLPLLAYFLYFLLWLSTTRLSHILYKAYTNNKDYGHGIFSHIYLVAALVYPRMCLDHTDYIKTLISICFMDSFASVVGIYFGSQNKSLCGFIGGQIISYAVEYAVLGSVDLKYHLFMGLIEAVISINDNILIPIASVYYLTNQKV